MSCRSTPVSSAITTLARKNATGLTDEQCQSVFHMLQREYRLMPEPPEMGQEQYLLAVANARQQVAADPLTDKRRTRVLNRLEGAENADLPSERVIYSLLHVRNRSAFYAARQRSWISRMANRIGVPAEELHKDFVRYQTEIDRSRDAILPDYTEENRSAGLAAGLLDEAGTIHAMLRIQEKVREAEAEHSLSLPRRILRQQLHVTDTGIPNLSFIEGGWDIRTGRLELLSQHDDGTQSNLSYHHVPESVWRDILNGDGTSWYTNVRGNPSYAYADSVSAVLDAAAPRCGLCGQFADTSHTCPVGQEPEDLSRDSARRRWSRGNDPASETGVLMPSVQDFREALGRGAVRVSDVNETFVAQRRDGAPLRGNITGDVIVYRDENGILQINTLPLACTCSEYANLNHCGHADVYAGAIQFRLEPPLGQGPRVRYTPEERAQHLAEETAAGIAARQHDWMLHDDTANEARRTWRRNTGMLYSEHFTEFHHVYSAVTPETPVPYMMHNALDGSFTRGSGQAFGVEIEYDFPEDWTSEQIVQANRRIGEALYARGLTPSAERKDWHASHVKGFQDTHTGNWSFERDGSVQGGEIVTPGMYDEPETWENIAFVCELLKSEKAIASRRAGSHVHVGTGTYHGDTAAYAELARMFVQHEDVLYRLSSDPTKNSIHRPVGYCRPNSDVPVPGFTDISHLSGWHESDRFYGLNFNGVTGGALDHPEFRLFDASLDPGTIQAQVKLATGMVLAAKRISDAGIVTQRPKEPIGSHHRRASARGRRRHSRQDIFDDSLTTRSLLDTLFRRQEDKDQLIVVYAQTKWAKEPGKVPRLPGRY